VKNWKQKGVLDHICWVLLEAIRNVMQRLEWYNSLNFSETAQHKKLSSAHTRKEEAQIITCTGTQATGVEYYNMH
jgi:hypothetical protein